LQKTKKDLCKIQAGFSVVIQLTFDTQYADFLYLNILGLHIVKFWLSNRLGLYITNYP